MIKEWLITLYVLVIRIVFWMCRLFPIQNKVTFMVSFEENTLFIYEEIMRQQHPVTCVFLYKGKKKQAFEAQIGRPVISIDSTRIGDFFRGIYHLATSKKVIVDNYYVYLAGASFKKNVECVQIWHAAGAIKTFGYEDLSIKGRPKLAYRRFQAVYRRFHRIVVGSEVMADRFCKAFHLPPEVILRTGVPRTDVFYNEEAKQNAIQKWMKKDPALQTKQVLLYAPTYRDQALDAFQLELDLTRMQQALSDRSILILKLHPAIKSGVNLEGIDPSFVRDYSKEAINELLFIADLLITDYSSIPVEFAILDKPMLFFAYDEEDYLGERGLWEPYKEAVPGPIVRTTDELIQAICEEAYDIQDVRAYSEVWNRYSKGESSKRLVEYLFRGIEGES